MEGFKLDSFQDTFICRRVARLQINFGRWTVRIRITLVSSNFIIVQKANRSFSQQCRVGNYFAWCRFTNRHFSSASILRICVGNVTQWVSQRNSWASSTWTSRSSQSNFDTCVFESIDHVPINIPNRSHSTQLSCRRQFDSDPNDP